MRTYQEEKTALRKQLEDEGVRFVQARWKALHFFFKLMNQFEPDMTLHLCRKLGDSQRDASMIPPNAKTYDEIYSFPLPGWMELRNALQMAISPAQAERAEEWGAIIQVRIMFPLTAFPLPCHDDNGILGLFNNSVGRDLGLS